MNPTAFLMLSQHAEDERRREAARRGLRRFVELARPQAGERPSRRDVWEAIVQARRLGSAGA